MQINDIRKGDIVTYRTKRVNHVNNPDNYKRYFNKNFENPKFGFSFDIMKIQRYVKFLCFYRLKTIYRRNEKY